MSSEDFGKVQNRTELVTHFGIDLIPKVGTIWVPNLMTSVLKFGIDLGGLEFVLGVWYLCSLIALLGLALFIAAVTVMRMKNEIIRREYHRPWVKDLAARALGDDHAV